MNFIDSKCSNVNDSSLSSNESKNLGVYSTTELISSIGTFDPLYGSNKNIMFTFNKKNTYKILKNRKNITTIFKSAFSSMDSLISKPFFSIRPNLLIIDLFFF